MIPIFIEINGIQLNICMIRTYSETLDQVYVYYNDSYVDVFNIGINEFKAKIDEALAKSK